VAGFAAPAMPRRLFACYKRAMAKHQFEVGARVRLISSLRGPKPEVFTIVRLVPGDREDLPPAYRVKAVAEGHERMVKEDDIQKA
jgi:hypothetical protein